VCEAMSDSGATTGCQFHDGSKNGAALHAALLSAEQVLGPCCCGHNRITHLDDESTPCGLCDCKMFALPPVAPTEEPQA